jgi:hypothetical protein
VHSAAAGADSDALRTALEASQADLDDFIALFNAEKVRFENETRAAGAREAALRGEIAHLEAALASQGGPPAAAVPPEEELSAVRAREGELLDRIMEITAALEAAQEQVREQGERIAELEEREERYAEEIETLTVTLEEASRATKDKQAHQHPQRGGGAWMDALSESQQLKDENARLRDDIEQLTAALQDARTKKGRNDDDSDDSDSDDSDDNNDDDKARVAELQRLVESLRASNQQLAVRVEQLDDEVPRPPFPSFPLFSTPRLLHPITPSGRSGAHQARVPSEGTAEGRRHLQCAQRHGSRLRQAGRWARRHVV